MKAWHLADALSLGIVGYLQWETAGAGRVRSLQRVTDTAEYGAEGAPAQPFGVAAQTAHAP